MKTNECLMCFPLVNDLSRCRMMDFNMFINYILSLHRLSGSNNCLFKINARVFPANYQHFCFYRCLFIIYYLSAFDNLHLAPSYSFNFCASSLFF